jgi:RHH-type proline utilization regulon transcriptional repressor/proline dehydrogenase/delta 1-pyrroline-5-carboxylate dehydrogenase
VAFTGSKEVGLNIVQTAGQTISGQKSIKRIIAELGGKNAVIIDETADLDEAVKGVVESSTGFQGQKCSACSRVILVGPRYDEFLVRLKDALAGLRIGSTEDPGIEMGPVIDLNAVKKIAFYVDLGSKLGKVALHQKELPNSSGFFVSPVILTDIDPKSDPAQDEIFGPVLIVFRAKDLDEALEIAMEVPYALTGGLFSRSPKNIEKIMNEFKVGNLYINRKITGAQVNRQPFGGFAMSGVGFKAGGPDYLLQFLNSRSISENTFRKGFAPMP